MEKNVGENVGKNTSGITLIALVVTIVILLILAGISINLILGNNGIIGKAQEASTKYIEAAEEEELNEAIQAYKLEKLDGNNVESLKKSLQNKLNKDELGEVTNNCEVATVVYHGKKYKISFKSGEIIEDTEYSIWDGTSQSNGLIGEGTEENPYLIYNANDFIYFVSQMKTGESIIIGLETDGTTPNEKNAITAQACYKLMCNIAINDVSDFDNWDTMDSSTLNQWLPIGKVETTTINSFMGKFDGNNYEITGLYTKLENEYYLGLFSNLYNATVENIRVTKSNITGDYDVGGIVGHAMQSNIRNCYFSGKISTIKGAQFQGSNAGGIVGCINKSTIENCVNDGTIIGKESIQIGGIAGSLDDSEANNCYNSGNLYGDSKVGGIIGITYTASKFINCFNEGKINCNEEAKYPAYFGGIIGYAYNFVVKSCNNYGDIEVLDNTTQVGGIIGFACASKEGNYSVSNCTNNGNITKNANYVGGIIGQPYRQGDNTFKIKNCTNNGDISSNKTEVGDIVGEETDWLTID